MTNKPTSKVIQITHRGDTLCEDGSIWYMRKLGYWECILEAGYDKEELPDQKPETTNHISQEGQKEVDLPIGMRAV